MVLMLASHSEEQAIVKTSQVVSTGGKKDQTYPIGYVTLGLTLSWDKIVVNKPWFSNVASDWLAAVLAANQKLHLKIVVSYPCFYSRIVLVVLTPAGHSKMEHL